MYLQTQIQGSVETPKVNQRILEMRKLRSDRIGGLFKVTVIHSRTETETHGS